MSSVGRPPDPRGEIVIGSRRHRRIVRRLMRKHCRTLMRWCDDCHLLQPVPVPGKAARPQHGARGSYALSRQLRMDRL